MQAFIVSSFTFLKINGLVILRALHGFPAAIICYRSIMNKPYWLYRLISYRYRQIVRTLPARFWKRVQIVENNEPLVLVRPTERIITNHIHKQYRASYLVRVEVAHRLHIAADSLPKAMKLVLIEGYRSMEDQERSWNEKVSYVCKQYPNLTPAEVEQKVVQVIARPSELSNHNCGGAVDVALAYQDGTLVDMGTLYPSGDAARELSKELSQETLDRYPMFSSCITVDQKRNRKILRAAMEHAGFVWYPGEWWHYCYNDRMWALCLGNRVCGYGPVNRITTQMSKSAA